jgi:glycosyltransferase involved in cell wall biosynthesis
VTIITCAPNFPEGKVYPGYKNKYYQTEYMAGIRVVRVKTFIAANVGTIRRILDYVSYLPASFCAGLFQARPDVVAATSPLLFAAMSGWALARMKRVPFVMEVSDLWPGSIIAVGAMKPSAILRLLEKIELFLYRQAARIVVLTPAFKENLVQRGIAASKIAIVMNGVDLSRFEPRPRDNALASQWGISGNDFVLSYIGTLGMAHGLGKVLECARLIGHANIKFMFVGPGAERENLVREASKLGLKNVIFVPPQPKEEIPRFWSLSDVALVHLKDTPLFRTVIPSKIFEAMGMGLPILLVAPEGEASRIILEENAGIWVPAGDPGALAEAVQLLASDPALRSSLAELSRAAALHHSREQQAEDMMGCFTRAITLCKQVRSISADRQPF